MTKRKQSESTASNKKIAALTSETYIRGQLAKLSINVRGFDLTWNQTVAIIFHCYGFGGKR